MFDPINQASIAVAVAERIRNAVLRGEIEQGAKLAEAELAEQMGVSRGVVREAFGHLRSEGLITLTPRKGASVVALSPQDILEVCLLRGCIEGISLRMGMARVVAQGTAELAGVVREMEVAAGSRDVVGIVGLDLKFHEVLCRASGYRYVFEEWRKFNSRIQLTMLRAYEQGLIDIAETPRRHEELIGTLAGNDGALAEQAVRNHYISVGMALGGGPGIPSGGDTL